MFDTINFIGFCNAYGNFDVMLSQLEDLGKFHSVMKVIMILETLLKWLLFYM